MLLGYSIVNGEALKSSLGTFKGFDPSTGVTIEPEFHYASVQDLNHAAELADEAFVTYSRLSGKERGKFLRHIATGMEGIAEELVARANKETGLPEARLKGELARTVGQLRIFAQVVEEGSWANARIDPAEPERKPMPRADIRSVLRPLGPIAVFGSSNFPLAFSVAGGDTASALAGGNPVIVKAHSAHPGTSELVGQVISRSVKECGLPAGVFALLFGAGTSIGMALVKHPKVKGVGFTGSLTAGRALMDAAAARPEPIPCFMEMSSVNPVFILPEALKTRGAQIAAGLYGSFTLGVGQMCTKPGLIFLPENEHADALVAELKTHVEKAACSPMLTEGIANSYHGGVAERKDRGAVKTVAVAGKPNDLAKTYAVPIVFEVKAGDLLADHKLAGEIFGPSTLIIRYKEHKELVSLVQSLEGQLTATVHGTDSEIGSFAGLIAALERKAGRLIVNGFPTGVEVCHAMVHGGPYPATADGRFTSVGTLAIYRWARPVCYQDFPQAALPEELKDGNPLGILRLVNGAYTRDAIVAKAEPAVASA